MALKATVYKTELNIADMDRDYYGSHTLSVAQHPSETHQRMMLRIGVFALNAADDLEFGRGISTDDEPDIWQKNLTGEIEHWIELGQPDEKRVRKACGRAAKVSIYTYTDNAARIWWDSNRSKLERFTNLTIINVPDDGLGQLESLVERTMKLNCNIQDKEIWISNAHHSAMLKPVQWYPAID